MNKGQNGMLFVCIYDQLTINETNNQDANIIIQQYYQTERSNSDTHFGKTVYKRLSDMNTVIHTETDSEEINEINTQIQSPVMYQFDEYHFSNTNDKHEVV